MLTVADGKFTYALPHPNVPGNATPVFPAMFAADGSFAGQIVAGSLTGTVTGGRIQGRIDGSACIYEFSGNRV